MSRFCLLIVFCLLSSLPSPAAVAHPISISDAYVNVQNDRLEVKIEVFVEDLFMFHGLKLSEQNALPLDEITRGAKLHETFLQERFKILDATGKKLTGKLNEVNKDDLPGQAIPFGHLMFFKLVYEFTYPLAEPPEYLTFLQDFTTENTVLPAEVLVKVKPVAGRRMQQTILPNQPWTVRLSNTGDATVGDDSATPQERFERMRNETLGITSYGETYVFLYLEPQEIRVETLIPLATLAASLDRKLEPDGLLDVAEQEALRGPIGELFQKQITLTTNGEPLSPEIDRIDYFGVTFRDFSKPAEPAPVSIANARVGIIERFPRDPEQTTGQLEWNLFNESLYQIQLAVIDGDQTSKVTLRQISERNLYDWEYKTPELVSEPRTQSEIFQNLQVEMPPPFWSMNRLFGISIGIFVLIVGLYASYRSLIGVSPLDQETGKTVPDDPNQTIAVNNRVANRRILRFTSIIAIVAAVVLFILTASDLTTTTPDLLPPDNQASVTETLLENVYSAFNQREEEQIFGDLEQVVDGPLLRDLYLEIRQSMTIEQQGGATARAGTVELLECEPAENPPRAEDERFARTFTCRWQVPGTVEHWGHIHRRTTSYLARLTVAPRVIDMTASLPPDQQPEYRWKLVGVDLLNQDQSIIETSVRKF